METILKGFTRLQFIFMWKCFKTRKLFQGNTQKPFRKVWQGFSLFVCANVLQQENYSKQTPLNLLCIFHNADRSIFGTMRNAFLPKHIQIQENVHQNIVHVMPTDWRKEHILSIGGFEEPKTVQMRVFPHHKIQTPEWVWP